MGDPLSGAIVSGVVGGVSGKVLEMLVEACKQGGPGTSSEMVPAAVENLQDLVRLISRDLEAVKERFGSQDAFEAAVQQAFMNPDVRHTLRESMLSAARTNNPTRHETLSRAVVERILAAPDSTQAVASSLAVEVLGRLSGPQMDLLGLTALLYYIAPVHHAPEPLPEKRLELPAERDRALEMQRAAWKAEAEVARVAVTSYLTWLSRAFSEHVIPDTITSMDFAHLVAASCATYDRGLHRGIEAVLQGRDLERSREISLRKAYEQQLDTLAGSRYRPTPVRRLWDEGLQHLTLTPSGLLIGTIVHQLRTGEEVQLRWERGPVDSYRDDSAWNGREVNRDFYDALKHKLEGDWSQKILAGGHLPWDRG